jgi:hypothetical protein
MPHAPANFDTHTKNRQRKPTASMASDSTPPADGDDFNDGFDVTAPPVLHGVPFAGRARFSILSHLRAAHSSGGGLFGFMTMRTSCACSAPRRAPRSPRLRGRMRAGSG